MNEFKHVLQNDYGIDTPDFSEAIAEIKEKEIDPIPILLCLSLDDYLDFLDEFFEFDNVFFQDEAVDVLFMHLKLSSDLFLKLCKEEHREPTEIEAEDFLSSDYAAVAEYAADLCLNEFLTDGAAEILYENLLAYEKGKEYAEAFWVRFAYCYILRLHKVNREQEIEVLLDNFGDTALQIYSSSHLEFCTALCSFNHSLEEKAIDEIVQCTLKSRDWLLSACATVLEAYHDGLIVNILLPHSILGEGQKISTGLARLVRELGYPEGEDDCGPVVFSEFMVKCFADVRVVRIVSESHIFFDWMDEMMQDEDERKHELVLSVGRIMLRKMDDTFESKARLMKIMSGKPTNVATSVSVDIRI